MHIISVRVLFVCKAHIDAEEAVGIAQTVCNYMRKPRAATLTLPHRHVTSARVQTLPHVNATYENENLASHRHAPVHTCMPRSLTPALKRPLDVQTMRLVPLRWIKGTTTGKAAYVMGAHFWMMLNDGNGSQILQSELPHKHELRLNKSMFHDQKDPVPS